MSHNPFDHLQSALDSLDSTMGRQDHLLRKFTDEMPSVEYLLRISENDMDKVCAKMRRQLAALTRNLTRTLPRTRESAQLLEENVPLFVAHLQTNPPRAQTEGSGLLWGIDGISGIVSRHVEFVQNFKKAIELMRDNQGVGLYSEAVALLEVLDEITGLYNRQWFAYRDIIADLRARL